MQNIDGWLAIQYVVSFILPILVGLVTKRSTSAAVKAVLLAFLAAVTSVGTEALAAHGAGTGWAWQTTAFNALVGFTVAVAGYFGLWKPTGVAGAAQDTLVKD